MGQLSIAEMTLLRSNQQRMRLYVAIFGVFQAKVTTTLADAGAEVDKDGNQLVQVQRLGRDQWKPVLNIGPHRLAFVNEPIMFDARDSYEVGVGYGGNWSGGGTWNFDGGTASSASGDGPIEVSWATEGLKTVTFSQGGATARRWVRVYENRQSTGPWSVTQVGSVAGGWGAGCTASLTLQATYEQTAFDPADIADFKAVGIFAEDEWWDGGNWVRQDIGWCRQEPRTVMIGYVRQGSTQTTWDTRSISVTLETIESQLSRTTTYGVSVYNGEKHRRRRNRRRQIDGDQTAVDATATTDQPADDADLRWGWILEGFPAINVTHAALWLLQFRTNILEWHDFYTCFGGKLGDLQNVANKGESSVQSVLATWADNDWLVVGCTFGNALYVAPDRQVTVDSRWKGRQGVRATLTDLDLLRITTNENLQKVCRWVQLTATDTFARPDSDDYQFIQTYPGKVAPTNAFGVIYLKNFLHDSDDVVNDRAKDVYDVQNLRWTASVALPLNRAIQPGDYVEIDLDRIYGGAGVGKTWDMKRFLVRGVAYQCDPANGAWQTQLDLEETIND